MDVNADLLLGDCLERMAALPDASVDAVVTDPPYGINFMGNAWDGAAIEDAATEWRKLGRDNRTHTERGASMHAGSYDISAKGNRAFQQWTERWALEAFRVLKPGGHLLSFASTRTYHRMTSGIEDAGFEVRDTLAWMFGSGFPKSMSVEKALRPSCPTGVACTGCRYCETAWELAERWRGWGTALKPAFEPIALARKPLIGTVAANITAHSTGALNVDGCRIEGAKGDGNWAGRDQGDGAWFIADQRDEEPGEAHDAGRWPANVLLDEEAGALLDTQAPDTGGGGFPGAKGGIGQGAVYGAPGSGEGLRDTGRVDANGGASRFFYSAKVSRAERNAGLDGFEPRDLNWSSGDQNPGSFQAEGTDRSARNHHPTVKPIALMRWLARLVTPPGGVVLDPFLGSGTTGIACALEGFRFVGIEREPDYMAIAEARIRFWTEHGEDGLRICAERDAGERVRAAHADAGQLDLLSGQT